MIGILMGIFSKFKNAITSSSDAHTSDDGSDSFIASVCKFDPSNVKDEVREKIANHIKDLRSQDTTEQYNKEEVALIKMLMYYDMSGELHDIRKELETGIKYIIEMEGDSIPNRTLIKVYNSSVDL